MVVLSVLVLCSSCAVFFWFFLYVCVIVLSHENLHFGSRISVQWVEVELLHPSMSVIIIIIIVFSRYVIVEHYCVFSSVIIITIVVLK